VTLDPLWGLSFATSNVSSSALPCLFIMIFYFEIQFESNSNALEKPRHPLGYHMTANRIDHS
jgi:hypothetical protein